MRPGEIVYGDGPITINAGRRTVTLRVTNTSDQPVQVTSHYHFFEANTRLEFDRALAFGMRLDVPAGGAVRWEPGETNEVSLVEYAGGRQVWGFNGLVDGVLTEASKAAALERARERGFLGAETDWTARSTGDERPPSVSRSSSVIRPPSSVLRRRSSRHSTERRRHDA